jgi:hypothetical protein
LHRPTVRCNKRITFPAALKIWRVPADSPTSPCSVLLCFDPAMPARAGTWNGERLLPYGGQHFPDLPVNADVPPLSPLPVPMHPTVAAT